MDQDAGLSALAAERMRLFRSGSAEERPGDLASLSLDEAYAVQDRFVEARARESGRVVGWKVGCTSDAIRRQFGLKDPISGRIFDREIHPDGARLQASRFPDCAVEPELVIRLKSDLEGEASEEDVVRAVEAVGVGIELHRYRFWHGAPTSQELIVSNGIHAGLVLGGGTSWSDRFGTAEETAELFVNGALRASGSCADIMGGPLRSLQWLARHAATRGRKLRAGELVIPGSAVELIRVGAGDRIEARFSTLGSCAVSLE